MFLRALPKQYLRDVTLHPLASCHKHSFTARSSSESRAATDKIYWQLSLVVRGRSLRECNRCLYLGDIVHMVLQNLKHRYTYLALIFDTLSYTRWHEEHVFHDQNNIELQKWQKKYQILFPLVLVQTPFPGSIFLRLSVWYGNKIAKKQLYLDFTKHINIF